MPKQLTGEELQELKSWLSQLKVSYKNVNRDFSDALLAANLLKKLYPKLVELNNYPARNNTQNKLNNWKTLNHKVLTKLGLQQQNNMLEKFAKSEPGAIEVLLLNIMQTDKMEKSKANISEEQEKRWSENNELITVMVKKKIGDTFVQSQEKMILYSIYEEAERHFQEKDNVIQAAKKRIHNLKNAIKLKSQRINELYNRLANESVKEALSDRSINISRNDRNCKSTNTVAR